ncbi:MAG TPA: OmpH family outer membrane protein [Terriglobales bacterium]|nr:OmpH family outer membrane protein [Terriglobales bacterium]
MTSKFARFLLAPAFALSVAALAQTGTAAASPTPAALPSAPSAAGSAPAVASTGTKIGTINIEQAIFATNEGRRDFETLSKKLEPKQTELKGKNDEIESLKKQLNTQGDKLNDDTRNNLVKQIESKQKTLDRDVQDAREEAQTQQNEIAQRILQKMAPVIQKYAADNGYGVLLDTSTPWPQGPVIPLSDTMDVTKAIVEAYNAQSGVAPPAAGTPTPKPTGATRPAGTTTKPATPAPKPQ